MFPNFAVHSDFLEQNTIYVLYNVFILDFKKHTYTFREQQAEKL